MVVCFFFCGVVCLVFVVEDFGVGLVLRFIEVLFVVLLFDVGSSWCSELVLVLYDSLLNGEVDLEFDMMVVRIGFLVLVWGGGGIED